MNFHRCQYRTDWLTHFRCGKHLVPVLSEMRYHEDVWRIGDRRFAFKAIETSGKP